MTRIRSKEQFESFTRITQSSTGVDPGTDHKIQMICSYISFQTCILQQRSDTDLRTIKYFFYAEFSNNPVLVDQWHKINYRAQCRQIKMIIDLIIRDPEALTYCLDEFEGDTGA